MVAFKETILNRVYAVQKKKEAATEAPEKATEERSKLKYPEELWQHLFDTLFFYWHKDKSGKELLFVDDDSLHEARDWLKQKAAGLQDVSLPLESGFAKTIQTKFGVIILHKNEGSSDYVKRGILSLSAALHKYQEAQKQQTALSSPAMPQFTGLPPSSRSPLSMGTTAVASPLPLGPSLVAPFPAPSAPAPFPMFLPAFPSVVPQQQQSSLKESFAAPNIMQLPPAPPQIPQSGPLETSSDKPMDVDSELMDPIGVQLARHPPHLGASDMGTERSEMVGVETAVKALDMLRTSGGPATGTTFLSESQQQNNSLQLSYSAIIAQIDDPMNI